eukprot:2252932-Alexandrium_andersonii.AAC.1
MRAWKRQGAPSWRGAQTRLQAVQLGPHRPMATLGRAHWAAEEARAARSTHGSEGGTYMAAS